MPQLQDLAVVLHPDDSVTVARRVITAGLRLDTNRGSIAVAQDIPAGHKLAIREIAPGQPILKYGQVMGFAANHIACGDHVHLHNVTCELFEREYDFAADSHPAKPQPARAMRYFDGYARADGRVGTRNYIAVISNVNCSATVARRIAEHFSAGVLSDYPHVDGVIAFTHKSGCAMEPGAPMQLLNRVLTGIARHPNVFGYIMVGLGCETNQLDQIRSGYKLDVLPQTGGAGAQFLSIQQLGGTRKAIAAGIEAVMKLLPLANACRRTPQPIGKLILGENCGGSDAASGITANPALGVASDELIRHGGTSVLAETPEIYGAEHLLIRRAIRREVGEKLLSQIRWWERHVQMHDSRIDNNPSYGNKLGGLTTIYEKSLGALAKAGTAPLSAVYEYAEQVCSPGLVFMDTPGYDPVSMTGLAAGGCNLAVFTTGRGSIYGCRPTPCIKLATNTALFEQMPDDMDLNAGGVLDGTETIEQVGHRLFELIIQTASGRKTRSELLGIGDEEFAPWLLGPTL